MTKALTTAIGFLCLVGCCDDLTKSCPSGPRYDDFFNQDRPRDFHLIHDGDPIEFGLGEWIQVTERTIVYSSCDEAPPYCGPNFMFAEWGARLDSLDIRIKVESTVNSSPWRIQIKVMAFTDVLLFSSLTYDPVELSPSQTLFGTIELNGITYHDIFRIQGSTDEGTAVIYLSRTQEFVGLDIEYQGQNYSFSKP